MASNYIRDGFVKALQPVIATCGYIRPAATLETEKKNFDPHTDPTVATPFPFPTVGGDIVISPPPTTPEFKSNKDAYCTITANADSNLRSKERGEFMRAAVKETATTPQGTGGK